MKALIDIKYPQKDLELVYFKEKVSYFITNSFLFEKRINLFLCAKKNKANDVIFIKNGLLFYEKNNIIIPITFIGAKEIIIQAYRNLVLLDKYERSMFGEPYYFTKEGKNLFEETLLTVNISEIFKLATQIITLSHP